jgi:hypothetical protein
MTYSKPARPTTNRMPIRRIRVAGGLLVVIAAIAASAGCGGTRSSSGTSTAGPAGTTGGTASSTETASSTATGGDKNLTARDKAVKFTECMRENGVGDFPDPNASGEFPSFGISVSPAEWERALGACKELQPPGSLSAKLSREQLSTALKFAQCMRANGVKDFPDPVDGQPLIDTTKIPSSNRPGGMTILNAAGQKCRDLLTAAMAGR